MKNLSLGARFAIIAITSSLLTVALLATTAYRELVADFETVLTQRQQLETETLANRVNQRLQIRLSALGALTAQLTDGQRLLPPERLEAILKRQRTVARYFDGGLTVLDNQAMMIAEDRYVPGRIGTSYIDRPHFQEVLRTGEPYISRPIIGRATGALLLSFLYPIRSDQGDLVGLANGSIRLDKTQLLPDLTDSSGSTVFRVLDTQSFTRVDSSDPDNPLPPLPAPGEDALTDAALSGITSGVVTDNRGKRWIYATRHLERVGWLFLRAVPYQQAIAPARASFAQFITISLLLLAAMVALLLTLSRTATQPLQRMATGIRRMIDNVDNPGRLEEKGAPEIRSVARAFNRLMDEREALDKLKRQFVSNVSHELRTPLTSINGSLKLLAAGKAGTLPDKATVMVDVALRNSDQLQHLISDLLDFNKAVAGQLEVHPEAVSVNELLDAAGTENQSYADRHEARIVTARISDLRVVGDPYRLRQILDNFISNACKFSPPNGTVTLQALNDQHGRVRIIVSDEGKGVPDDFLPRLFGRFAQAEASSARSRAGTGLGLAICRELAHLMDGEVGYYYDQGACFWVDLPEADIPADPA